MQGSTAPCPRLARVSTDSPHPGGSTPSSEADQLDRAIGLAETNVAAGQLPFGALVVRDGVVLGEGVNTSLRDLDPAAHAEVAAIRAACRALGTLQLDGATVVSSCEPCPMCQTVAILAGIRRIVYAAPKEAAAAVGLALSPAGVELAEALRASGAGIAEHVPVPRADAPFERYRTHPVTAAPLVGPVAELRLARTVDDYDGALRFYGEGLGLPIVEQWETERGRGTILDAGRATLEILSTDQADFIDEVEVGRRVAGPFRVALEVDDSAAMADRLEAAGAVRLAGPVVTPWAHRNVRLDAPDGMQLTLFTVLPESAPEG